MTDTTAPATVASRSLADRIAAAKATLAKLEKLQRTEEVRRNLKAGDTVTFTYGRAEKARTLTGNVRGVGDVEVGKGTQRVALIETGEGLDIQTLRVNVSAILTINGGELEADEEATEAPADVPAEAPADETDPLNFA